MGLLEFFCIAVYAALWNSIRQVVFIEINLYSATAMSSREAVDLGIRPDERLTLVGDGVRLSSHDLDHLLSRHAVLNLIGLLDAELVAR